MNAICTRVMHHVLSPSGAKRTVYMCVSPGRTQAPAGVANGVSGAILAMSIIWPLPRPAFVIWLTVIDVFEPAP